ncbi:hypothetical protein JW879_04730 [candidate division WOR-3 bacterium]|nr:hypothetical protein [candidate division WOR-3 bacterium]
MNILKAKDFKKNYHREHRGMIVLKREKTQSTQRRSLALFVQGIVLKNRSQFPRCFISRGVLFEKNRVHFTDGFGSGVSLRKTAVSFPCEETAAWLSTSLLLALPKDHARSVSETFFLSDTPSLISRRN